jgi:hypothetical protein
MNNIKTISPYIVQGPATNATQFLLPMSYVNMPTTITITNASAGSLESLYSAVLNLDINTPKSYLTMGTVGSANTYVTPAAGTIPSKYIQTGNFPFGKGAPNVPVFGSFTTYIEADSGAGTVLTQSAINQVGATDVILTNSWAQNISDIVPNVVAISSGANAQISMTGIYFLEPDAIQWIPFQIGMTLNVSGSTSTGTNPSAYDGQYTITGIDPVTKVLTTSRNTTGATFGTFVSTGMTYATPQAYATGRILPQNTPTASDANGTIFTGTYLKFVDGGANSIFQSLIAAQIDLRVSLEYTF